MPAPSIQTQRLLLRQWKEEDLPLFAKLNCNPLVMEHFPALLSKEESDDLARRIQKELKERPYGLWAVERTDTDTFIGFVGLHEHTFETPFTPCIEIGWRIDSPHWRQGFAFEAAKAVLAYAFDALKIQELVSFTTKTNTRSIHLMEKLGMTRREEEDFEHPKLKEGHRLRPHVLYRISSSSESSSG